MTFTSPQRTWWKEAMVYQVWPASFCDSDGDGIGDLKGVTSRLDHIKSTGAAIIWISPCFKSPQVDMGYDVSDYRDIHEAYGTLQDLDDLISGAHDRGIKVILDLVLNHSSEEHDWFKESRSSVDNPKRNWYHWAKGTVDKDGNKCPPNNWESIFKGSAWEYDDLTDEWYLHLFVKQQPDFNWDNPELREALYDIARFWLDRGCDGFRLDAVQFVSKPVGYPDAEVVQDGFLQPVLKAVAQGPRVHEYMKDFNKQVLSKYDCYTVGETAGTNDPQVLLEYIRPENKELNTVFHFELAELDGSHEDYVKPRKWALSEFREITNKWQRASIEAGAWNAIYLENHDQARSVSRYASDKPEHRIVSATMLAMHLATLCGTIFVYQGQELGQINVGHDWAISDFQDVGSQNLHNDHLIRRRTLQGKDDVDMSDVVLALKNKSRDNARTPMQWTDEEHGGHKGKPWMRMHEDHKEWNATAQSKDPKSVLSFYQSMFKVRKENDVLVYGDFHDVTPAGSEELFVYRRDLDGRTALVLLNFSQTNTPFVIPTLGRSLDDARLLIGNYDVAEEVVEGRQVELRPYEGRVYLLA